jgi:hypothetical protein
VSFNISSRTLWNWILETVLFVYVCGSGTSDVHGTLTLGKTVPTKDAWNSHCGRIRRDNYYIRDIVMFSANSSFPSGKLYYFFFANVMFKITHCLVYIIYTTFRKLAVPRFMVTGHYTDKFCITLIPLYQWDDFTWRGLIIHCKSPRLEGQGH